MAEEEKHHRLVRGIGAKAVSAMTYAGGMTLLLGATGSWLLRGLFVPRVRFGRKALAAQMVRVGVRSLPIVVLVQTFIGVILALQMTPPLQPLSQEDKIANIIGVAGFRMLGPILTAVVLSGFAGASIAAELGTMVVAEEIEAMEAMALNAVRFLVVPRVLATFLMMILLTVISDVMIAFGGWAIARLVLPAKVYFGYWDRMQEQLRFTDFNTGLIMGGVFGILISLIACYEGLKVKGGAEGVGKATTQTVVNSIVAIVSAACVFTAIFYRYHL